MNDLAIILAKSGTNNFLNALGIVVIMVIVGISQLVAKRKKEQQQREEQEKKALASRQSLGRTDQAAPQSQQARPPQHVVRRDLRQPRAAVPSPVIVSEPEDEEVRQVVDEEMRRQQQRRAREQAEQRQRMAKLTSQVAQRESVVTVHPHIRPAGLLPGEGETGSGLTVDLADPQAARRAIILHEILSPPKALRREAEIWDT